MSTIVIMPGGFHPFHAGHFALYQSAKEAFPDADLYVAATNDMSERPFPFQLKEKLAKLAGVEPGHFVQVKSPFQAKEITSHYNPEQDVLVFVRSEKDRNEQPKPGGTKKDGSPAYFQPWTGKDVQPFAKHAYLAYLPTVEFGPGITSATQIRKAWPTLNDKRKLALVMSLYPAAQKNPKLAQNVVGMFDQVMGGQQVNEFAAGGDFKPPVPPKQKGNDPFGNDDRSKIVQAVRQLLKAGNKVDWKVPGQMGHVVRADDHGVIMKRWGKPYSKIHYSLHLTDDQDDQYQIMMVKPGYYKVISTDTSWNLDEDVDRRSILKALAAAGASAIAPAFAKGGGGGGGHGGGGHGSAGHGSSAHGSAGHGGGKGGSAGRPVSRFTPGHPYTPVVGHGGGTHSEQNAEEKKEYIKFLTSYADAIRAGKMTPEMRKWLNNHPEVIEDLKRGKYGLTMGQLNADLLDIESRKNYHAMRESDLEEGWKEKVGAAALAGAVATGAGANTPKVPVDKAIQQATAVYNINKAVKKHKEKEAEKRKSDKQVKEQDVAEGAEQQYKVINHKGAPAVMYPNGKINKEFSSMQDALKFAKKMNSQQQGVAEDQLDEAKIASTEDEDFFHKGKKVGSITKITLKDGMVFYRASAGNSHISGSDTRQEALRDLKELLRREKEQGVAEGSSDKPEAGDKIVWYHSNHYPKLEGEVVGWKDGHLLVKSIDPNPRNTEKTVATYRVPKNNIMSVEKQGVVEGSEDKEFDTDIETQQLIRKAQQHYPQSHSKQQAFIKFAQRALKHSEDEDKMQDSEISQLQKDVAQIKQVVNKLQVSESSDYIDEK